MVSNELGDFPVFWEDENTVYLPHGYMYLTVRGNVIGWVAGECSDTMLINHLRGLDKQ